MKKIISSILSVILAFSILLSLVPITSFAEEIQPMSLTVVSESAATGSEVSVEIKLENNPGISSLVFDVGFDENLSLKAVELNSDLFGDYVTTPEPYSNPQTVSLISPFKEVRENGTVATMTFSVSENAEDNYEAPITLNYDRENVFDGDTNNVNLVINNGNIKIFHGVPGDINKDKAVNNKDAILLFRYVAGWKNLDVDYGALDVNGDGSVNNKDAITLFRYVAKWPGIKPTRGFVCNHELEKTEAENPTCSEEGNIAYWHCEKCGKYFGNETATSVITLADTVISALGHDVVIDEAVPATYDKCGWTEGSHCARCNEILVPQEEIPKLKTEQYSITFDIANGDTYLASQIIENPNPKYYSSEIGLTLKSISVPGYKFLGWYDLPYGTNAEIVKKIPEGSKGNIELYAHWTKEKYHVNFDTPDVNVEYTDPDDGTILKNQAVYYVDSGLALINPEWYGYTFIGWSNDSGFIVDRIKPGTIGEITLHANWTSNRNRTVSKTKYGEPQIIENNINGQFLFVYDIGTVENVVLNQIEYIGNSQKIEIDSEYQVSNYISQDDARKTANVISNATTRSSGWTLSKDWNNVFQTGTSEGYSKGISTERVDFEGNTVGGKYFVSNSEGGSSYSSTECGASQSTSAKITMDKSKGLGFTYDTATEKYADTSLGVKNETELSAGVSLPVKVAKVEAGAKNTTTLEADLDSGRKDNTAFHIDGTQSSYVGTVNQNEQSSFYNALVGSDSNWNTTSGYESSYSSSRSTTVSNAIAEEITKVSSYNISEATGGADSKHEEVGGTDTRSEEYSTSYIYSQGNTNTTSKRIKFTSDRPGYYRLVEAGTVHTFGVVGYDVATSSYFTYTYNVLDNERHEYLDYSKDNARFDDCENGIIDFEIPFEVCEYVSSICGATDGMEYGLDNIVTGFDSSKCPNFDGTVLVPEYYSVDNLDNTYSAYKTIGINPHTFKGNKDIKKVVLPIYVKEIPDGAFEGCSNLESIIAFGVTKIGNYAFKGCTNLKKFYVDNKIDYLGKNAFCDVSEIGITAKNSTVADSGIESGAKKLTLNLTYLEDSYDNRTIEIDDNYEYFALISAEKSNGINTEKTYSNLEINSEAEETFISNIIFENNTRTPLKFNSKTVTLNRVNVKNSGGISLVLLADDVNLKLFGNVELSSKTGKTLLSKNVSLSKASTTIASDLTVKGNHYICTNLRNAAMEKFINGALIVIDIEEFNKMLNTGVITFEPCSGFVSEKSKVIEYGEGYGNLPIPTRDNYIFDGWYTEDGEKITSESIFNANSKTTLYAHWIANVHIVTFNANGGNCTEVNREVDSGTIIGELPVPVRDGFDFLGWFTDETEGIEVTSETEINEDMTLFAHWAWKPYSVTWENGTGYSITVTRTSSNNPDASIGILSNGANVFFGDKLSVSYSADATHKITTRGKEQITVTGDVTSEDIYLSVDSITVTYSIKYITDGGNSLGSSTVTEIFGSSKKIVPPKKDGYGLPNPITVKFNTITPKTIVFVYRKEQIAYSDPFIGCMETIEICDDGVHITGWAYNQNNPNQQLYVLAEGLSGGSTTNILRTVNGKTGYFGFDFKVGGTGGKLHLIAIGGDTQRYISGFTDFAEKHIITYNANGGSNAPESSYSIGPWNEEYGAVYACITYKEPVRSGYTFVGWSTSPNGSVNYLPGSVYCTPSNVTLYAIWEKNQ